MKFTLEEIKRETGGRAVYKTEQPVFAAFVNVSGVSTDTRTIEPGEIFFALRGPNFNGGDYSRAAIEKGACAVVVDNAEFVPDGAIGIVVDDTVDALCKLAGYYRDKLGAQVVAVTGSVGKTTTRTIIAEVLSTGFRVHSTVKNNNNEIGMSRTILEAPEDTQVLVVEMGMRGEEQIKKLSKIARPDIAVITNVGYSHIGLLGSRENILKAKMEITEGLTDKGVLIVNGDDSRLLEHARRILSFNHLVAVASVSDKPDEISTESINAFDVSETEDGTTFSARISRLNKETETFDGLSVGTFGNAGVRNVLFALLCAHLLELGRTEESRRLIKETINNAEALDGRGAITDTKKYMIVNDAYNAAPESMENAFLNFSKRAKGRRKILALGGMLELGEFAPSLHEMTGKDCAKYDFDKIFITGDNSEDFIRGAHMINMDLDISRCRSTAEVGAMLSDYLQDGDAVLFKASNGFGFEKLAKEFIEKGDM
ncbi:MAG: UDP-N-acetylmuramoyl-tripeptide--D-alanyl-D-alanine ligase [Clostridiales bacterium]|nr:UDP-N-acetylmuramoyl-tripeptide--D-alanyl-D-alanine ligase [Clostridiales bacterium]